MLFVCPKCTRRYQDTASKTFRCLCGELLSSSIKKPFYPEIVRCAACGGGVDPKTHRCLYCVNTVKEFDSSNYCLACFAFLERAAKFCSGCGTQSVDLDKLPISAGLRCPKDGGELSGIDVGGYLLARCPTCFGVWISKEEFDRLVDSKAEGVEVEQGYNRRSKFETTLKYIACPECASQLSRKNFERISGVILDTCEAHGVWLDVHELEDVANFLKNGGRRQAAQAREKERERLRVEREKIRRMNAELKNSRFH